MATMIRYEHEIYPVLDKHHYYLGLNFNEVKFVGLDSTTNSNF